ncbi:MAG: uridine kinase [Acidobacteria bacterium]|nr:uridine kinase [Acidobacteriota bacterium]
MNIADLTQAIDGKRSEVPAERSMLVGISGIDASGKGYVTAKLAEQIKNRNVAVINVDGWLNLPDVRFDPSRPAEKFYENALRLDEMFEWLILPLKENRSVDISMDYTEETATEYRPDRYKFDDIEIILLEGIFLFKRKYASLLDLKIWIDCFFETALRRAISRAPEGLPSDETIRAYETIYFPAQRRYFKNDLPKNSADIVFENG